MPPVLQLAPPLAGVALHCEAQDGGDGALLTQVAKWLTEVAEIVKVLPEGVIETPGPACRSMLPVKPFKLLTLAGRESTVPTWFAESITIKWDPGPTGVLFTPAINVAVWSRPNLMTCDSLPEPGLPISMLPLPSPMLTPALSPTKMLLLPCWLEYPAT